MKREILFKARRADGEGWVEGDLVRYKNTPLDIDITSIIKADGLKHAVLPNTVCQYTGLKDKNGVKIFEGDIDKSTKAFVRWRQTYGWFQVQLEYTDFLFSEFIEIYTTFEVAGNIHDK